MNLGGDKKIDLSQDEITIRELIIGFKDWFVFLLKKWVIILCFGIFGCLVGFGYSIYRKPIYTAISSFVLEESSTGGGLGQYAGLASMVGIDLGSGSNGLFTGDNILELYKSRKMVSKTLLSKADFGGNNGLLIDQYINMNELRDDWKNKPELKSIRFDNPEKFTRTHDSVLNMIVNDIIKNQLIVYKPDKKLSIIKVEFKATDEDFTKSFTDKIVENVNSFYIETKTKRSIENVNILQQKTDSVRYIMTGAIYSAAKISDATPNLNPTRQIQRVAPIQKSQFTAETNKAILSELVKNLELAKIALRKESPLIQVIDEPILPLKKDRVGKLKGIFLGGILFGFIAVMFLSIKLFFKNIFSE